MSNSKKRPFEPCHFLPYREVCRSSPPKGHIWIDVSSYATPPFDSLSPYTPHGDIPVPGMEGTFSDCVEGIWQGLKVIRSRIAPRYFKGRGKKRGGKPSGHSMGGRKRLLKLEEAGRLIYVPSYEWMLEQRIESRLIHELLFLMYERVPLFFYDRESNGSIHKNEPLA
ncbi:MAG: hypothetical protein AAGJ35_01915, partial [Myxococcota bacterium]